MDGQKKVKCRDCDAFGKSGSAPMRAHGFGSCDVLGGTTASACAKATYKSAEFDRRCDNFKPKNGAGEGGQ